MPKCNSRTKGTWIGATLLVALLTLLCIHFLDVPVGLYVKNHLYANARWSRMTSNLPDLLQLVVILTSVAGFSMYLIRSRKGIYDSLTIFARHVAWVAPASYLVKYFLKFAFGRVNTRYWVQYPDLYGFYWFQNRPHCEGFPSGHMVVLVSLMAAAWRFHPVTRPLVLASGCLLAAALVATNYHFVSDVIAGAYLGVLIEAVAFRLLLRGSQRVEISAERPL